jgi:tRNA pseudouridine13 synthase
MRRRFQDFHVRELDLDGNPEYLDALLNRASIADEFKESADQVDSLYSSIGHEFNFPSAFMEKVTPLVTADDLSTLTEFLRTPVDDSNPFCVLPSSQLNDDKDNRKAFHGVIREFFGSILSTDTLEEGDSRSIRVWIKKFHESEQTKYKQESLGNKRPRTDRNNSGVSVGVMMKNPWPKDRPDHLHFRLYKENRDTAEAIQSLARCLRIPPKSFSTCGTKDRRGITVQSVSVYRISIETMKRAILHPSWDNAVRVSHFEYKSYPNKIGRSGGNRFSICLRRIDPNFSNEQINSLFEQLKSKGFLNYYGLQRFGTRKVRTHHVGGLLMAQNWKGVVDALLSPEADACIQTSDSSSPQQASRLEWRFEYANGNIEKALELCPPFMYIEKSLLRALHISGQSSNYLNAIQSLPSSNVQLYLHAVQSLVFNAVLSERVKRHGLQVMIGDLVEVDGVVSVVETEEDKSKYSIHNVVLSLVGNAVQISPLMESSYESFLTEKFNVSLEHMRSPDLPPLLQLKGAYRNILAQARNLEWAVHENVSDQDVLIKSDVDILSEREPTLPNQTSSSGLSYKAVKFDCDLASGVYLTMALREITEASELSRTDKPSTEETLED